MRSRKMHEEVLFETPELRITTERLIFYNATFEVGYLASTNVSEKMTIPVLTLVVICVLVFASLDPLQGLITSIVALMLTSVLPNLLPKKYIVTITMTDKMFYEVITRTREEAEIIQKYVEEAMGLFRNRERAAKRNTTAGFSKEKWQLTD